MIVLGRKLTEMGYGWRGRSRGEISRSLCIFCNKNDSGDYNQSYFVSFAILRLSFFFSFLFLFFSFLFCSLWSIRSGCPSSVALPIKMIDTSFDLFFDLFKISIEVLTFISSMTKSTSPIFFHNTNTISITCLM